MPELTTKQRLMKKKAKRPSEAESVALDTSANAVQADIKSLTPLGEQALLDKAGLDGRIWRVVKVNTTQGSTWLYEGDTPTEKPIFYIKAEFRRNVSQLTESSVADLAKTLPKLKLTSYKRSKPKHPSVLELSLTDHHFGKLCWGPETGKDYDTSIAERYFEGAIQRCLDRIPSQGYSEIVLPLGNDFYNFDGRAGNTESGTPVDNDGRYAKVYSSGITSIVKSVHLLRSIAPVRVVWVPGNHDFMSSYWLVQVVKQAFANCRDVVVDDSPTARKYYQFGRCLIGWCHGNNERHAALPQIMATEQPEMWAKSPACKEWHLGHFHQSKATHYVGTHETGGVTVRILPSLAGTDAWHSSKGYVMSRHATQAFLYDYEYGMTGSYFVSTEELG